MKWLKENYHKVLDTEGAMGSGVLVTEEQTLDEEGNVSTELTE